MCVREREERVFDLIVKKRKQKQNFGKRVVAIRVLVSFRCCFAETATVQR